MAHFGPFWAHISGYTQNWILWLFPADSPPQGLHLVCHPEYPPLPRIANIRQN